MLRRQLTIIPTQKSGNELQDLELLRVRSVQAEEMQKMIGDNMSVARQSIHLICVQSALTCQRCPPACLS